MPPAILAALTDHGDVLATLTIRRGHGGWTLRYHAYRADANPNQPEMGVVKDAHHHIVIDGAASYEAAMAELERRLA